MWNCVDDKNDNEEGRAPLEYLPRGPRVSSYATDWRFSAFEISSFALCTPLQCSASVSSRFQTQWNGSITEVPTSDLRVAVGAHKLHDTREPGQKRHSVAQVVIHEQYVRTRVLHDIMLLKVSPPIQFNVQSVRPICVDGTEFRHGYRCMVTGWGSIHPASTVTRSTLHTAHALYYTLCPEKDPQR